MEQGGDASDIVFSEAEHLCIARQRRGKGFTYRRGTQAVRDAAVLDRIRALAIPPAWNDVRICELDDGHLQAVGRDARGRRQYLYHPRFRALQEQTKFEHLATFASELPKIREQVESDLRRRDLSQAKVLAAVVRLLDLTGIRVGNRRYARLNGSFGLTTLRDRHVDVGREVMRFSFRGKSGRTWRLSLRDRRLASVVRACQDVPGQHLFQYIDEAGERRPVSSGDVNAYLREASGRDVTAKEFRTWSGTVLAARLLSESPPPESERARRIAINAAIREVAQVLGNTVPVCRRSYIHPFVLSSYESGDLAAAFADRRRRVRVEGLDEAERTVLALMRSL